MSSAPSPSGCGRDRLHPAPKVTSEKRPLAVGWAYNFRHRRLGVLGRLLIRYLPNGQSHLSYEVFGDPADAEELQHCRARDQTTRMLTVAQ